MCFHLCNVGMYNIIHLFDTVYNILGSLTDEENIISQLYAVQI